MNHASIWSFVVPGLAGRRPGQHSRAVAGAAIDHALQDAGDEVGGLRRERLFVVGLALFDDRARGVGDLGDEDRIVELPAGRERVVGPHQLEQRHLRAAERDREVARERPLEAEAWQVGDQIGKADVLRDLHGDDVDRVHQRLAQPRRSAEFLLVVLGLPDLVAAIVEADRRIDDDRRGRVAVVERRGIDERLERGTGLTKSLYGAVELASRVVVAADHGAHVAGVGVERQKRALGSPVPGRATLRTSCPASDDLLDLHQTRRRRDESSRSSSRAPTRAPQAGNSASAAPIRKRN